MTRSKLEIEVLDRTDHRAGMKTMLWTRWINGIDFNSNVITLGMLTYIG